MAGRAFAKYEGLGNDFVVVDAERDDEITSSLAASICDRRRGVGADGVLLVLPAREAGHAARMRVINADGSVPEMCGNGLRCVALHVASRRGLAAAELAIETDAGLRACVLEPGSPESLVTVDMGVVRVDPDIALELDGERLELAIADAGNPHAITFARSSRADAERFGPRIAVHPRFPSGTNAEFARVTESGIDLIVWERGVGLTLACGTGACATVAAACNKGLVAYDAPVDVRLPGGALRISVARSTGRATMRGPARHVFSGQIA